MHRIKAELGKLRHPVDPNYEKDWFIGELFPLTRIRITQKNLHELQGALKQEMKIEAMAWYFDNFNSG